MEKTDTIRWNDYEERIQLACQGATDVEEIPRQPDAGEIVEVDGVRWQMMFNGLRVKADGYYGDWMTELIRRLKGHHEPQEERVFHEVLRRVGESPSMIELGAYWAWYSMWFKSVHSDSVSVIVEPSPENLEIACRNIKENRLRICAELGGIFPNRNRASSQGTPSDGEFFLIPSLSVEGLMEKYSIGHLSILHADIQGAEYDMLEAAAPLLSAHRIDYLFVSTHWLALHHRCKALLESHGYRFVAEHTPEESFTVDGLIVAHSPLLPDLKVEIRKARQEPQPKNEPGA